MQPEELKISMDFGEATRALKLGKRVARAGWNSRGQWRVLIHPGNAMFTKFGSSLPMQPCIGMRTTAVEMQPGWLASQAGMLAEDWEEVA